MIRHYRVMAPAPGDGQRLYWIPNLPPARIFYTVVCRQFLDWRVSVLLRHLFHTMRS
ncbi:hypothetical protein BC827DRAFT_1240992 [Russula dissimulans]|nr:hypothetical protein BC827DRAFT_1240992 [Russula dissimulans]